MIIVYSTRGLTKKQVQNFSNLVASKIKSKAERKLDRTMARIDAKAKRNIEVKAKLSVKAKRQPRRLDGKFAKPLPKPATVENNPLVTFFYPMSHEPWNSKSRVVRLISANPTHITGLESTGNGWKYKKFLATKAKEMKVMSFNPKAMS